jgi:hypothetical protein
MMCDIVQESRVTGTKLATHIAQLRDSIVANMV